MSRKKDDAGLGSPLVVGLVVGGLWTVVAGTVWQWVPIAGALAAVYAVKKAFDDHDKRSKK